MPPTFAADFPGPFGLAILPLLAGAAAVFLLLPRPKAYPALWGGLAGAAALALAGWLVVGVGGFSVEAFLFYIFSGLAVVFGVLLVTQRKPARAALSFTMVVLSTCGLFLLLAAPFLMAATIIIYAGAIIVTFLFVLMLAQQEGPSDADARSREPLLAVAVGFVLLGALLYVLQLQWNGQHDEEGRVYDALLAATADAKRKLPDDVDGREDDFRRQALKPLIEALKSIDERKKENSERPPAEDPLRARLAKLQTQLEGRYDDALMRKEEAKDAPTPAPTAREKVLAALGRVEEGVYQARQQHGWPRPNEALPLSNYSGPPPNLKADDLRVDAEAGGRPYMPADNPAYLGQSLFTDYLLPVELGGFLLLVAVIGAVAIAQRRPTPERPS
jgi:NADH:ubiquinone oxidoreductase subunit 6 (subunit J)